MALAVDLAVDVVPRHVVAHALGYRDKQRHSAALPTACHGMSRQCSRYATKKGKYGSHYTVVRQGRTTRILLLNVAALPKDVVFDFPVASRSLRYSYTSTICACRATPCIGVRQCRTESTTSPITWQTALRRVAAAVLDIIILLQ